MTRPGALGVLLLLLAAACVAEAAKPVNTPKPRVVNKCEDLPPRSTAAFDWLQQANQAQPFSDFMWGVRRFRLMGLLREVSKGKALILPSNAAFQTRFMKLGMYKAYKDIPKSGIEAMKKFIMSGVAVPRSRVPPQFGCEGSVYVAHQFGVHNRRLRMVGGRTAVRAAGAAGAADYINPWEEGTELQYSVLGTGYNSAVGMPLAYGMSSLDPGLTLTPLFNLNATYVKSLRDLGGACKSQFSTSTFNSVADMKSNMQASLGLKAGSGGSSFSLNGNFQMLSQSTTASQTITTSSTAQVYLGAYGLASSPANLPLDAGFIKAVAPLCTAASQNRYDPYALQGLVDNYGTHYIRSVYWGGLASVLMQMSSSSSSSLSKMNISVSIAAQASSFGFDASFDYDTENSQTVNSVSSTFSQVLIPSNVTLAMAPSRDPTTNAPIPSFIDCNEWTANLKDAADKPGGYKAPVHYTISPITEILSYADQFPQSMRMWLPAAQDMLYNYINKCGYTSSNETDWIINMKNQGYSACAAPVENCVVGTYPVAGGPGGGGGCNTCFGDGTKVGPNCDNQYTLACTSGACYCQPWVAKNATLMGEVGCVALAPSPPAPPLSMTELLS